MRVARAFDSFAGCTPLYCSRYIAVAATNRAESSSPPKFQRRNPNAFIRAPFIQTQRMHHCRPRMQSVRHGLDEAWLRRIGVSLTSSNVPAEECEHALIVRGRNMRVSAAPQSWLLEEDLSAGLRQSLVEVRRCRETTCLGGRSHGGGETEVARSLRCQHAYCTATRRPLAKIPDARPSFTCHTLLSPTMPDHARGWP